MAIRYGYHGSQYVCILLAQLYALNHNMQQCKVKFLRFLKIL